MSILTVQTRGILALTREESILNQLLFLNGIKIGAISKLGKQSDHGDQIIVDKSEC